MRPAPDLLELLNHIIDARVDRRLRELGIESKATTYYDAKHLPPGIGTRQHFSSECKRLGLSAQVYKPGRAWRVPSLVWEQARTEDRRRRRTPPPPSSEDKQADEVLKKAGLRLLKGGDR